MTLELLNQITGIAALFIASIALILGCISISIIVGLKNSTHQVQMIPMDKGIEELNDAFMDKTESRTSDDEANRHLQKTNREELADEMSGFSLSEDDQETFAL
jgi:hypothetical protein